MSNPHVREGIPEGKPMTEAEQRLQGRPHAVIYFQQGNDVVMKSFAAQIRSAGQPPPRTTMCWTHGFNPERDIIEDAHTVFIQMGAFASKITRAYRQARPHIDIFYIDTAAKILPDKPEEVSRDMNPFAQFAAMRAAASSIPERVDTPARTAQPTDPDLADAEPPQGM